jgi:hypothetical protein
MNERIKELMVRLVPDAFMTYKGYLYHSSDPKVFEHSDPEPLYTKQELVKFAELIVRECAKVVDRGDGEMSSMDETIWCNVCRDDILKHFGVEE